MGGNIPMGQTDGGGATHRRPCVGHNFGVTQGQVARAEPPMATVSQEHFIGTYLAKTDPWDNATSWHNRRKYAVAMASLPRERYSRAYEPGCAIGMLTRLLAERCDELLAVDCVDEAVATAREQVLQFAHVRVEPAMLPAGLPDATFDLI